jgi:osmotically-inducible protein OsmY
MFFALAMFGLAAAAPLSARCDDNEIARQIIAQLKEEKAAGRLQGFDIDLKVEGGVVYVKGRVATPEQESMVLETARLTPGVTKVMRAIQVTSAAAPAASVATEINSSSRRPAEMEQAAQPAAPAPRIMPSAEVSQPESLARASSRRNSQEQSAIQLLAGPAVAQPISLAPPPAAMPEASGQVAPVSALKIVAASDAASSEPPSGNPDKEIADELGAKLRQEMTLGRLDGRELAYKVEKGVVWLRGTVASAEQEQMVIRTAQATPGVTKIMKNLQVAGVQTAVATGSQVGGTIQTAATQPAPAAGLQKAGPAQPQLMPVNPYYGNPYAGYYPAYNQTPVAFAPAQPASAEIADSVNAAGAAGMAPYCATSPTVAMGAYGGAGVRYDHPNLPGYAWPTYAAYPNYGAVTYPKTYSPTVWPYIGPFYPYPQVPLGWRKVVLEWDDGWWQLDFKDQSRPWKMR